MRLVVLFLTLAACNHPRVDPDRLVKKCVKWHWQVEVQPLGSRDITRQIQVCDQIKPLVRYQHQTYELGPLSTEVIVP